MNRNEAGRIVVETLVKREMAVSRTSEKEEKGK
jgi:hypothetical protein